MGRTTCMHAGINPIFKKKKRHRKRNQYPSYHCRNIYIWSCK